MKNIEHITENINNKTKDIVQIIFEDNTRLERGPGRIDNWCVYYYDENGKKRALRDIEYFRQLKCLSLKYGAERIYKDYVQIYNNTHKEIESQTVDLISAIASQYEDSKLEVKKVFSELYMTMISEENKKNTRLGKRIKRLGVYALLLEGKNEQKAANFMRHRTAEEISQMCSEKGF